MVVDIKNGPCAESARLCTGQQVVESTHEITPSADRTNQLHVFDQYCTGQMAIVSS